MGLGTWITFNVGDDAELREECAAVMRAFFREGGRVIDSSPMYGSSQSVIGAGLEKLGRPSSLFSADEVWISSGSRGPAQIEESRIHWGVRRFDLLQVHNLLAWEEHLPALLAMKAEGQVRYVGITTSEGRRHGELETIMASRPRSISSRSPTTCWTARWRVTDPSAGPGSRHRGSSSTGRSGRER